MARMFGTDGVRGIANEELTPLLAMQLGQAGAYVLTKENEHKPTIMVGCDTRISGDMLANAVRLAKEKNPDVAVEVEVDSIRQIQPVLDAEADVIMLDNFSYADLKTAVDMIGDKAWTEASGGITLDNIGAIGKIGPDFVSTAAPVHSGRWIDIGLDS